MSHPTVTWEGVEFEVEWDDENGQWLIYGVEVVTWAHWTEHLESNDIGLIADNDDIKKYLLDIPEEWEGLYDKAAQDHDERMRSMIDRTPEDYE